MLLCYEEENEDLQDYEEEYIDEEDEEQENIYGGYDEDDYQSPDSEYEDE